MGQVADNLVDLAEFRARRAPKQDAISPPAPPPAHQLLYPGFPVAMPMMMVSCVWVPVWVPVAAPQFQAESRNA